MARRASSGINPMVIIGAIIAIALVVFVGKSFTGDKSSSFGDARPLRIEDLLENGNSLRNLVYVVEGEIDEKLQFSDEGQLVSVKVDGPKGDEYIGITIPTKFDRLNIETKQRYAFLVKFKRGGVAVAQEVDRL